MGKRKDGAVTISRELYAFLMGEGPLEGVWFGDMNEKLPGSFWWRGLLRCAAGWPASADRSAEGEKPQALNAKHESAVDGVGNADGTETPTLGISHSSTTPGEE